MDKTKNPPVSARDKLKETIIENARNRKITRQYEILSAWDKGKITGLECIAAIEDESKIFRIENDLMNQGKK